MADGVGMIGTEIGVVVGTAVLTENPVLTSVVGAEMVPVVAAGTFDVYNGANQFWEGLTGPGETTTNESPQYTDTGRT